MTDQDKGTPTAEENKENNLDKNKGTQDGADESGDQRFKDQQKRAEKAEAEAKAAKAEAETAKAKAAELEKQLASAADPVGEVSDADIEKLAEEHGVSVDFAKGLVEKLAAKLSKQTEALVSSKLSEKDKEREKERILTAFKADFDKVDADEFDGATLNEQAVRSHYLTEKAKNPDHTVADSVEAIYGSFKKGKPSVEDDPQGADQAGESIDFATVSKDSEKLNKVLKDPKARKAYYAWRDKQGN